MEDGQSILNKRLATYPDEIITLRALMDNTEAPVKNDICEKYNAKTKAEPKNANAYYISARCLVDPAQSRERYLEGVKKWPQHGWINYANSFYQAKEDNWQEAYNSLQTAYQSNVGLQPAIALNTARIERYLESQGKTVDNKKRLESDYLNYYESVEIGSAEGSYEKIISSIHQGKLEDAMNLTNSLPDITVDLARDLTVICAASDGASSAMVQKALALNPDSLQADLAILSAAGLSLRKNRDIAPFEEALKNLASIEDYPIMDFVKHIRSKNFSAAKNLLREVNYTTEAELYAMACLLYTSPSPRDQRGSRMPSSA